MKYWRCLLAQATRKRYETKLWKNVIPVYVCKKCGRQEDIEDEMILHVLTHEPDKNKEEILEELLEDKFPEKE